MEMVVAPRARNTKTKAAPTNGLLKKQRLRSFPKLSALWLRGRVPRKFGSRLDIRLSFSNTFCVVSAICKRSHCMKFIMNYVNSFFSQRNPFLSRHFFCQFSREMFSFRTCRSNLLITHFEKFYLQVAILKFGANSFGCGENIRVFSLSEKLLRFLLLRLI